MQSVQNMAGRVVTRVSKFDHITPIPYELHWLPIEQGIIFKSLVHTFKALHGQANKYICDMVTCLDSTRVRRSLSHHMLKESLIQTKYGLHAFQNNSAFLWNGLPLEILSSYSLPLLKKLLKTY